MSLIGRVNVEGSRGNRFHPPHENLTDRFNFETGYMHVPVQVHWGARLELGNTVAEHSKHVFWLSAIAEAQLHHASTIQGV